MAGPPCRSSSSTIVVRVAIPTSPRLRRSCLHRTRPTPDHAAHPRQGVAAATTVSDAGKSAGRPSRGSRHPTLRTPSGKVVSFNLGTSEEGPDRAVAQRAAWHQGRMPGKATGNTGNTPNNQDDSLRGCGRGEVTGRAAWHCQWPCVYRPRRPELQHSRITTATAIAQKRGTEPDVLRDGWYPRLAHWIRPDSALCADSPQSESSTGYHVAHPKTWHPAITDGTACFDAR